ncbi:thioesterase family protein [Aspergillus brunneoviolaceus CBS 621.78]|uniref:Uncharacterized protein n=1 Tax=Aspergillus brunneoviolaceus CBS 621.78 TaxID=1450534 RepID=A0ACD1GNN6_9EURO|nr:hypothetical protein BO95DRAFT_115970 [Aspergillus brunneoviolaceus CBS 621.78]RAH50871.1 hypothetical protein BO95DRAFT_115970 [Aspergillus brunneoviolaceus CBS 621.78]
MPPQSKPSLLEVVSSVAPVPGTRGQFTVTITRDWCTQHSVLGGFSAAVMLSAGRKFLEQELGDGLYPDPVHAFVQFLREVHPGECTITCAISRTSSRRCVVTVELKRAAAASLKDQRETPNTTGSPSLITTTLGVFTYADISKEQGLTLEPPPASTKVAAAAAIRLPLPNRQTECTTIDNPVVDATPVTRKMHWVAPRSANGLWGHRLGGHNREVWLSFRDGTKFSDILHLAYLSDLPLHPAATHTPDFYAKHAISTLCLSIEFKRRPDPATEWVLTRSTSYQIARGRYDVSLQIYDESGALLALSQHVVFVTDLKPVWVEGRL